MATHTGTLAESVCVCGGGVMKRQAPRPADLCRGSAAGVVNDAHTKEGMSGSHQ